MTISEDNLLSLSVYPKKSLSPRGTVLLGSAAVVSIQEAIDLFSGNCQRYEYSSQRILSVSRNFAAARVHESVRQFVSYSNQSKAIGAYLNRC